MVRAAASRAPSVPSGNRRLAASRAVFREAGMSGFELAVSGVCRANQAHMRQLDNMPAMMSKYGSERRGMHQAIRRAVAHQF